jgi:hypothetical protein
MVSIEAAFQGYPGQRTASDVGPHSLSQAPSSDRNGGSTPLLRRAHPAAAAAPYAHFAQLPAVLPNVGSMERGLCGVCSEEAVEPEWINGTWEVRVEWVNRNPDYGKNSQGDISVARCSCHSVAKVLP